MNRRELLQSTAVSFFAIGASTQAFGQDHLSPEQKADFSRNWGAQSQAITRRAQQIQDRLKAVPFSPRAFANSPMIQLFDAAQNDAQRDIAAVENWHLFVLDLTSRDHAINTNPSTDEKDLYGEQLGPARSSWALALVHVAMFEAMNAFKAKYSSLKPNGYSSDLKTLILAEASLGDPEKTIKQGTLIAAVSYAAYGVIRTLYPKKKEFIQLRSDNLFNRVRGEGASAGKRVGEAAAKIVLKWRGYSDAYGFTDGSEFPDPPATDFTSHDPKKWRPDPISKNVTALGGHWAHVNPFVMAAADQFRCPTPPAFDSADFIRAYKEVKDVGAWGTTDTSTDEANSRFPTPTSRRGKVEIPKEANGSYDYKNNDSFKAVFWGYDGTAFLCAPPRLYNMLASSYARKQLKIDDAFEFCRFLALVNVAMGDAGISAWEAKYHYLIPRPITFIRNLDADNTPEGKGNERWTPLGAAITNATAAGRNVTPPFPAYPSGHAVFGGAVFEMLRQFGKTLAVADGKFEFTSDEYNGENYSSGATDPRPEVLVSWDNILAAEEENGQSRIWMGIHWEFDKKKGIEQGNAIAQHVYKTVYALATM